MRRVGTDPASEDACTARVRSCHSMPRSVAFETRMAETVAAGDIPVCRYPIQDRVVPTSDRCTAAPQIRTETIQCVMVNKRPTGNHYSMIVVIQRDDSCRI